MTGPEERRRIREAMLAARDQPIPDGQRCINCAEKGPPWRGWAKNGVITHGPTCPEHGRVTGRKRQVP